jgi:hypothetical protein
VVFLLSIVDPEGMEFRASIVFPGPLENLSCAEVEGFLALILFREEDVGVPDQKCSGFGIAGVNNPNDHSMSRFAELVHMADSLCLFEGCQQQREADVY